MSQYSYTIRKNDKNNVDLLFSYEQQGIQHSTSKDFLSFYLNISNNLYFDTGLLPVFGSGILSIRSAGNHTQVAYQREPSINYVNISLKEGDPQYEVYQLAQPYRITIFDFVDNSLYGARLFYSPYPVTHLDSALYHVNLPNINCKGYGRNLGVGWVCLYHKDMSSNIEDFSELLRISLERTSGSETFNYANMSETDGITFYRERYFDDPEYKYLWTPRLWEQKTQEEGIDWICDENLLVPILVTGLDNQNRHDNNGVPLTFGMALTGSCYSYYNDPEPLKLVNRISRFISQDPQVILSPREVFQLFHTSIASAAAADTTVDQSVSQIPDQQIISTPSPSPFSFNISEHEEEDEDSAEIISCTYCGDSIDLDIDPYVYIDDGNYCASCVDDHCVYVANLQDYVFAENKDPYTLDEKDIFYNSANSQYYDSNVLASSYSVQYYCSYCNVVHDHNNAHNVTIPYFLIHSLTHVNNYDISDYHNKLYSNDSAFLEILKNSSNFQSYFSSNFHMFSYKYGISYEVKYASRLPENYFANHENHHYKIPDIYTYCTRIFDYTPTNDGLLFNDNYPMTLNPYPYHQNKDTLDHSPVITVSPHLCTGCKIRYQFAYDNQSEQYVDYFNLDSIFKLFIPSNHLLDPDSLGSSMYNTYMGYCSYCKQLALTKMYSQFLSAYNNIFTVLSDLYPLDNSPIAVTVNSFNFVSQIESINNMLDNHSSAHIELNYPNEWIEAYIYNVHNS